MEEQSQTNFRSAVIALNQANIIAEINRVAFEKTGGTISICYPNLASEKNKIHFIIGSEKDLSYFDLAELTNFIKERIGFDYTNDDESFDVMVQSRKLFTSDNFNRLFEQVTTYSVDNRQNVDLFLRTNYPSFFPSSTDSTSQGSAKKHRLESTSTTSFGLGQNASSKPPLSPEEVIKALQSNPELWHRLTETPSEWETVSQKVKIALSGGGHLRFDSSIK